MCTPNAPRAPDCFPRLALEHWNLNSTHVRPHQIPRQLSRSPWPERLSSLQSFCVLCRVCRLCRMQLCDTGPVPTFTCDAHSSPVSPISRSSSRSGPNMW